MFVLSKVNQFPVGKKKLFRKGQHLYHLFVRATFHQILSTPNNPKPNLPSSWQLLRHQVSPLLSYEGEGLGARPVPGAVWGWLESFVFFVPFSRCGRCGSFGAKGKEYAVSFRQNPGLGIEIRSICLCGNQGEPCILVRWMVADSFTSTKNTKTLPRVVSTWISQVLLHTSIVIHKLGWAMHHWLKKHNDIKSKNRPTESDHNTLGCILTCWVCESPLGNDPIWLVFNRVAHPPSCFVDWLSSTNVKFCRKQTRGPWWFHFDAWV